MQPPAPTRSITAFRGAIRSLLESEAAARRDVVILALDGVPHELAAALWPHARIEKMRSVFPTTSSSAWLSCLTGLEVARHGVPGVVFRTESDPLINVYEHRTALEMPRQGNIFSDAAAVGYAPVALLGDLEPLACTWTDALLEHSRQVAGHRFYAADDGRPPQAMLRSVELALASCLGGARCERPRLIWCFVEVDRRIHMHGYDGDVIDFLEGIDGLALRMVEHGAVVVAHSDHGLVHTRHDASIDALLAGLPAEFGCAMGGAGRTRWFYTAPGSDDKLIAHLRRELPGSVHMCTAGEVFARDSLARSRVGDVVLIARGTDFVTFAGQCFDHGSDTDAELYVPYAVWNR